MGARPRRRAEGTHRHEVLDCRTQTNVTDDRTTPFSLVDRSVKRIASDGVDRQVLDRAALHLVEHATIVALREVDVRDLVSLSVVRTREGNAFSQFSGIGTDTRERASGRHVDVGDLLVRETAITCVGRNGGLKGLEGPGVSLNRDFRQKEITWEGAKVKLVAEIMPYSSGLNRNIVQCLNDYDIPLHLGTTVSKVHGKQHIEGVTVVDVDQKLKPIPGTDRYIECDLLVLSVGLIPENELSENAGIEISPVTKGPVVNDEMMTSIPGIFAAGNVAAVFDLVDYVSETGEIAARGAARYVKEGEMDFECINVLPGDNNRIN